MTLYIEIVVDQTDDFAYAFVHLNVAYGYDVVRALFRSKVYSRRHFVYRNPM